MAATVMMTLRTIRTPAHMAPEHSEEAMTSNGHLAFGALCRQIVTGKKAFEGTV
jgi:hypothetical protein